jgi:hypothetical protein
MPAAAVRAVLSPAAAACCSNRNVRTYVFIDVRLIHVINETQRQYFQLYE